MKIFKTGDIVKVFGNRHGNYKSDKAIIIRADKYNKNSYIFKGVNSDHENYAHCNDMKLIDSSKNFLKRKLYGKI